MKKKNNKLKYIFDKNTKKYPRQARPKLYYYDGCVFIRNFNLIKKKIIQIIVLEISFVVLN